MEKLKWKLVRKLPNNITVESLDHAVKMFVAETQQYGQGIDAEGQYLQILGYIASACVKHHDGTGGDFWAKVDSEGNIKGWGLAHFEVQIDNKLTYVVTHGWFSKEHRDVKLLKAAWERLEQYAKEANAAHITVVTDRNARVFNRVLGNDWHPYVTILKKDLEG